MFRRTDNNLLEDGGSSGFLTSLNPGLFLPSLGKDKDSCTIDQLHLDLSSGTGKNFTTNTKDLHVWSHDPSLVETNGPEYY